MKSNLDSQQTSQPFVSIIIPVFNDLERLKICIQALDEQTYPKNKYEIIVVDNGSDYNLKPLISKYSQVITIRENRPGSYTARNFGLTVAKGTIIAFTDADCIPKKNWIEAGVIFFLNHPNCGVLGGKVEIFFKNPKQPNAVELYESIYALSQKKHVEVGRFSATANLFTSKEVVEKVGNFDENLKSGGDKDWCHKVAKHGYDVLYADKVCIAHPARDSFQQLYRRTVRILDGIEDRRNRNKPKNLKAKIHSYKLFVKETLMDLFPLNNISKILFKTHSFSVQDKFKIVLVLLFVRYVRIIERVKVKLGKLEREKW
jgi:glycosyltransferase involved in cell wall biosynthesis